MFISIEIDADVAITINVEKLVGIVFRGTTIDFYMVSEDIPMFLNLENKEMARRVYQRIWYALQDADMMIGMIEANSEDE